MIELYSSTNWYSVDFAGLNYTVIEMIDYDIEQTSYDVFFDGNNVCGHSKNAVLELLAESQKQMEET